ncbi:hypothetical protein FXF51_01530 [Nonomuraea sp. PA05]|uniref:hypothetical protein n=1 Tax=Nonomuraea sp. PA05 TaxID=2604466 RepID=UPI0011D38F46|nr:hypothetical protein [Nonomuraea sp. PA05]TYB71142.1 hypothetical protein FXF51_01530 [Nonomuraea sp. PA05]
MWRTEMTDEEQAAWKARKDAGRARAYEAELQIAALLRDHPDAIDGFRRFCGWMGGFYSIRNCLRIYGQNPQVAHVQPRRFWGGYGFGREVIDPGTAIWVVAPKVERTFTKEVPNKETGKTEEVEDSYKIWPIEDIYPAQATAPKGGPCVFCDGPEGEPCPESCPVRQPQAGPPPTREDVAEALAKSLKNTGGFDPSVLATLGPDPLQDDYGDPHESLGITWDTLKLTMGTKKRTYRYLVTVDLDRPGARFAIANLGAIWIGPYSLRRDQGGDDGVVVQYGDDVPAAERHWDSRRHQAGPHAPTINAITFAGTSIVYPSREQWRWFSPYRAGGGTVPEKTAERMSQIIRQLLPHYRGLVEYDAIEEAGFRQRAARRAREAEQEVRRLAEREQQVAEHRADAERRAAEHRHQAAHPNEL